MRTPHPSRGRTHHDDAPPRTEDGRPDSHLVRAAAEPGRTAERTGTVDLSGLPVTPGTHANLCGPPPFMRAVRSQLLDKRVASADIRYEVFGPDL